MTDTTKAREALERLPFPLSIEAEYADKATVRAALNELDAARARIAELEMERGQLIQERNAFRGYYDSARLREDALAAQLAAWEALREDVRTVASATIGRLGVRVPAAGKRVLAFLNSAKGGGS